MSRDGTHVVPLGNGFAAFADARACPLGFAPEALPDLLSRAFGFPVPVLYPRQRHTDLVFTFSGTPPTPGRAVAVGVCDALITAEAGVALAVQTADCLPVAIAGPGVVAMVHAGWRGLAAGLLAKTVALVTAQFGIPPAHLQAVIGVGVGPCHYPVGREVVEALSRRLGSPEGVSWDGRVDLAACAQRSLVGAGLPPLQVRVLPGCTACSPDHHSHRRDGDRAGRQWAAVVLPPAGAPTTP